MILFYKKTPMKTKPHVIAILFLFSTLSVSSQQTETLRIGKVLDSWHLAAANADFDAYFGLMTKDAVFIGTDATENWQNEDFRAFAKPYFDRGKAWSFEAIDRHIYISKTGNIAWFDELLSTQMKICRGSGILKKVADKWKIAHYVLSITVPNANVDEVVEQKSQFDDSLIERLKSNN
jgi:ketosteroid isomerase-like protein